MGRPDYYITIDFGSTYTKINAFDRDALRLAASVRKRTTVGTDLMEGFAAGMDDLTRCCGANFENSHCLACSSAAGGLRMVTIGLVPGLTGQAARTAAFGAGAKIVGIFHNVLNQSEIRKIESLAPDILLLCGGTDGGNSTVVKANAEKLSFSRLEAPVIFAGNKTVADEVCQALNSAGKEVAATDNVMPEIGVLDVEGVKQVIREIFIRRIVHAKGLGEVERHIGGAIIPTPVAVLQAAQLLASGTGSQPGFGELMIIDVGGATTDVHSVAAGDPEDAGTLVKGLPEPLTKRTVEGDIGVRFCVEGILEAAGMESIAGACCLSIEDVRTYCERITRDLDTLPADETESRIEDGLAGAAVEVAVKRHAGILSKSYTPLGEVSVLRGKDLRKLATVIGTGGVVNQSRHPGRVLSGALHSAADPFSLRPRSPALYTDTNYILFSVGLLREIAPDMALQIARDGLVRVVPE